MAARPLLHVSPATAALPADPSHKLWQHPTRTRRASGCPWGCCSRCWSTRCCLARPLAARAPGCRALASPGKNAGAKLPTARQRPIRRAARSRTPGNRTLRGCPGRNRPPKSRTGSRAPGSPASGHRAAPGGEGAARPASTRPSSWSSARRGRLFGRSDSNQELVLYAEAWTRKIELNMTFGSVRDAAKLAHADPIVLVAVRSDGSVESVNIVRTSGVPALDEAVRNTVQSQANYSAFPRPSPANLTWSKSAGPGTSI